MVGDDGEFEGDISEGVRDYYLVSHCLAERWRVGGYWTLSWVSIILLS